MKKQKEEPPDKPLRIGEISKILGITKEAINKLCKEGKLSYTLSPGNQKLFKNPLLQQSSSKETTKTLSEIPKKNKKLTQGKNDKKLKDEEPIEEIESRKLSSRALRRQENKEFNEFVIKQSLTSGSNFPKEINEAFLREIDKRVLDTSKAFHKLGILVNIYLLQELNKVEDLTQAKISEKLFSDTSFAYQLITGTDKATKPHQEVQEILSEYSEILNNEPLKRHLGDRNSLVTISTKYITNFKVYLQENFISNQEKYIATWCDENNVDKSLIWKIRNRINGWLCKEFESTPEIEELIEQHRYILGLQEEEYTSKSWVKRYPIKTVIYFHWISKYLESKEKKNISLGPLPSMKSSFLFIDKTVFEGILKKVFNGIVSSRNGTIDFDWYYKSFFNVTKNLTQNQIIKGFKFTGTLETDGVSVNLHYRRPKLLETDKSEILYDPKIRTIGVDPGRNTLFTGVEELDDGSFKKYTLSRKEFYSKSGMTKSNKLNEVWNKSIEEINQELSQTCKKSNTLEEFLDYVEILRDNYDVLWNELTKKKRARNRFRVYCGRKRVYDKFFTKILGSDEKKSVILAYGDAGFASTAKNEIAAPTTRLERESRKLFKVAKVDEFRTSKIHYETLSILAQVKTKKDDKMVNIRGLHWLETPRNSKFIDRDLNAAKNILRRFKLGDEVPFIFKRDSPKLEYPRAHFVDEKLRRVKPVKVPLDV